MNKLETAAKAIYDAFHYDGEGGKPAWVVNGNSDKQEEARYYALKALSAVDPDEPVEAVAWLSQNLSGKWDIITQYEYEDLERRGYTTIWKLFPQDIEAVVKDATIYRHRRFIEVSNRLALSGVMAINPDWFKGELNAYDEESANIQAVQIDYD